MVSSDGGSRMKKMVLGLGYWVQGFRYSPWLAVNFFLKDILHVEPATLQLVHNFADVAMVGKPLYGFASDSFYISGQHRIPYVAFGAFLQALSWIAIVMSPRSISIITASIYLFLTNLGAAIAEVANDAIVAEVSKHPLPSSTKHTSQSSRGNIQSFCWICAAVGAVLGNLLGGIFISWFSPLHVFFIFSIFVAFQFIITISVRESSLGLQKSPYVGIRKQLSELSVALRKREIVYAISWFALSISITPQLNGTMFYYQTQYLKVNSTILGISKVFGHATMLLWGVTYNKYLKFVPPRKLISGIQAMMALFSISDFLFVSGFYREMGVPDSLYVVVFSGFIEVLIYFKVLPFNVLIAQLCPLGCEGSIMAFLSSATALAIVVSGYLGAALTSYIKVRGGDFSGLPFGYVIQAACILVPIFWASCIPDYVEQVNEGEDDHMATNGAT